METIFTIVAGGIGGSVLTNLWNKYNNRIQTMICYLLDEDIASKIPSTTDSGQHKNIHTKNFQLINTTNKDIDSFKIIFEFDADAKILKQDTFCKSGKNIIKNRKSKQNEVIFSIKKFNRNDDVKFFFDIADVTNNHYNITESDCTGFKIKVKIKKRKEKKIEGKIVTKDKL